MSDSTAPSSPHNVDPPVSAGRLFLRGMRSAVTSVQCLVLFASMVGFGGLCRDVSFPLGAAMLSCVLIWALPAQVIVVSGYVSGTATPVIALAVALSSIRMFPMTASLIPYLRGRSIAKQLLAAHFIAVSAWIEGMRRLPSMPREERLAFFYGAGTLLVGSATTATVIGFLLAGTLPRALAIGLLFLTPLSFLIQLFHNARELVDRLALGLGLVIAPFMAEIGGRLDMLWTGLIGGGAAWGVHRFVKARKEKKGDGA